VSRPLRSRTVPGVFRWLCTGVIGAALTLFALLLVTGRYAEEGPILARFTPQHGVHAGDLVVLAVWALSMLALAGLARRSAPHGTWAPGPPPTEGQADRSRSPGAPSR
jgi:hypothetical protein